MAAKRDLQPLVRPARFKAEQRSYARDIDTYVRPQGKELASPSGRTSAESLAYALREYSPIFKEHFAKKERERQQALIAEGERLQKETGLRTWAEVARERPEYAKYSPYLREGFERQRALVLGMEYNRYIAELRTTDETLAQIQDPTEANSYLQQKGAEWIKANSANINDRAVQQYLLPLVNEYDKYHTSQITESRLDGLVQAKTDAFQTSISMGVEDSLHLGQSPEEVGDLVGEHINNTILDGSNPAQTNTAAVDSLLNLMQRKASEGDIKTATGVKAVLENLKGRDGAPIAKIMRYRKAIDTAWEKVGEEAFQQTARDRQLKAWEREDALQEVRDKYGAEIWKVPTANRTALLAQVAKDYGSEVAKAFSNDIAEALSYQRQYKAYSESVTSGNAGYSKQIKDTLIALSYKRPLTDEECNILASSGATVQQVMNARQGKNVQNDGTYKQADEIARKIINKSEADYSVSDYEQRRMLRGAFLTDLNDYRDAYHEQHGRLPSKLEERDHADILLIRYKKQQNEESKIKTDEREKEDKIDKVIDKNNSSSLFKDLPQITPEMLQQIIDEEKERKKKQ